jgi:hypothetical protein
MFPLTPELRGVLEAQRDRIRDLERTTGQIVPWVFVHPDGTRIKNFRYAWAEACRAADVPGQMREASEKLATLHAGDLRPQRSAIPE